MHTWHRSRVFSLWKRWTICVLVCSVLSWRAITDELGLGCANHIAALFHNTFINRRASLYINLTTSKTRSRSTVIETRPSLRVKQPFHFHSHLDFSASVTQLDCDCPGERGCWRSWKRWWLAPEVDGNKTSPLLVETLSPQILMERWLSQLLHEVLSTSSNIKRQDAFLKKEGKKVFFHNVFFQEYSSSLMFFNIWLQTLVYCI